MEFESSEANRRSPKGKNTHQTFPQAPSKILAINPTLAPLQPRNLNCEVQTLDSYLPRECQTLMELSTANASLWKPLRRAKCAPCQCFFLIALWESSKNRASYCKYINIWVHPTPSRPNVLCVSLQRKLTTNASLWADPTPSRAEHSPSKYLILKQEQELLTVKASLSVQPAPFKSWTRSVQMLDSFPRERIK